MRITVTLDDDVEQLLRDAMQRTRQSFKTTLNQAVRRGLAESTPMADEEPFEVHARPMGLRPGIDPARLNHLNDELEIEAFLELTRKLTERHRNQSS
jgi:hypothetical protein